ncbi:ribonuclease BN [Longimonas halophila]|uniref:Ribonuclease BN n=1 Tax=Longimonas halophila TaxID=1469170 RepID=A0A2H3P568_9BACT|nr:YihY/virulence factor BrkB family protein [Longimonas halophila]PEN06802.1 ribonuclease BN [Longimonas halophila]
MPFAIARSLLVATWNAYTTDKAERLGAALAYYAIFSLAPLLVLALAVARLVYGQQSMQAQTALLNQVESVVGPAGRTLVQDMLSKASVDGQGTAAVLIGSVLLLVGATVFFARLQDAMNTIWRATPVHTGLSGFVRSRLLSLLLVLLVGVGLVGSLVLSAVLSGLADTLGGAWGLYLAEQVGTLIVLAGLCALLFRVLPDASVQWADVWMGAIGTALLLRLGTSGIGWYLGSTAAVSAYGAAGALAALLLWMYYAAQIFFLGAEFTTVYAAHRQETSASELAA